MNALSRREEDTLSKTVKTRALKECDAFVRAFAECATGRTVTVTWACRDKYSALQQCMLRYTGPEPMERVRLEYLTLRNEKFAQDGTRPT